MGITGHTAPDVLLEAIRRHPFDTVLVSINPADRARLSFIEEFLPAAESKGMGVIAMKVMAHGMLLEDPVRLADVFFRPFDLDRVAAGDQADAERVADQAQVLIAAAEQQEGLILAFKRQGQGSLTHRNS